MKFHKKIIELLALCIPFSILKKASNNNIVFPFYHTISDYPLPHIKHLYKHRNIKQFEKDLDFLLENYKKIDFSELKNSTKPSFILSFDDGLSEIYNIIAPILEKKGITAIFFVNPAFMNNKDLFHKYKISLIIDELNKNKEKRKILKQHMPFANKKYLKSLKYSDNEQINKIAEKINVDFAAYLKNNKPYLSLEEIIELEKKGFTIGSHSMNHPEYNHLSFNEQIQQTTESINFVQKNCEKNCNLFAFPFTDFGVEKKFFEKIFSENIADYTFSTAGIKNDEFIKNIQRIPVENHNSIKKSLKFEYLYFFLKKIAGKNTIIRS
ncbi:MAG: polysaccharide deacetylase family protein [Bacteroidota bacterium]|nr:polysaccharide deacetylase family protein [Bacteroidota bacterium]